MAIQTVAPKHRPTSRRLLGEKRLSSGQSCRGGDIAPNASIIENTALIESAGEIRGRINNRATSRHHPNDFANMNEVYGEYLPSLQRVWRSGALTKECPGNPDCRKG